MAPSAWADRSFPLLVTLIQKKEIAVSLEDAQSYVCDIADRVFEGPKRIKATTSSEQAQFNDQESVASESAAPAVSTANNKRQSQLFLSEDEEPEEEAGSYGMSAGYLYRAELTIDVKVELAAIDAKPAPEAAETFAQALEEPFAEPSEEKASTPDAESITDEMDVSPGNESATESDDDSQGTATEMKYSHTTDIAPYRPTHPNVLKEKQLELLRALPEGFPRLACFLPIFKEAEGLVTVICDQFIEAVKLLREEGYQNEEIDVVCDDLEACRSPHDQYANVGPVACLGTTGKGKTSCISSLLDADEAAFASGGTKRGTYVSHEYRGALRSQTSDSLVEIFYLSSPGIKKQVKKFLSDILRFLALRAGDDSDEEDGSEDEDEDALMDAKHSTALECLGDILCGDPRFSNASNIEDFCRSKMRKTADDHGLQEIFSELLPTIKAVMVPRKRVNDIETIETANAQAVHQQVKQLTRGATRTRGAGNSTPSPWPFITKVQVHQANRFLEAGLALSDTPGSGDRNHHVLENTNRSLKEAGTIMIVTQCLRFSNDEALQNHLKTCIRLGKMHEIILVLTKTDELKDYSEEEKLELSREEVAILDTAEDRFKTLRKKVDEASRQKEAARGNAEEFMRYDGELGQLVESMGSAARLLRQAHIQLRCAELRRQAANLLRDVEKSKYAPKLKAFPVSNTQYQLHVSGGNEHPFLDFEATGVPGLRRELLRISSGGKFNTLQHLCTRQLPWIFAGIDGILTKTPTERTGQLRRVLDRLIRQESQMFMIMRKDLLKAYDETVLSTISKNSQRWADRCSNMIKDEWISIHGGTLAGILKRAGKWKHKKLKKTFNWSKEIHAIFLSQKHLTRAFEKFTDRFLAETAKGFNARLKGKLDAVRKELTQGQYSKGLRMGPFSQYIMGTYEDVERSMDMQFEKLEAEIESIRHTITLEPENDDYSQKENADGETYQHIVGQAMKQTYKEAKAQDGNTALKGRTLKKARLAVLEAKLTSKDKKENLFHCIGKMGRDRLERFFDDWAKTSREIVDNGFAKIQKDFDNRFRERVAIKTEDQPEAEEKLRRMVAEAESVINGRLKDLIKTCEEFEKADNKV